MAAWRVCVTNEFPATYDCAISSTRETSFVLRRDVASLDPICGDFRGSSGRELQISPARLKKELDDPTEALPLALQGRAPPGRFGTARSGEHYKSGFVIGGAGIFLIR